MFLASERILLFPFVHVWDEGEFMKTSIIPHEETKLAIILNDILWELRVEVFEKYKLWSLARRGRKIEALFCVKHQGAMGLERTLIIFWSQI